jgi:hypothetical protein
LPEAKTFSGIINLLLAQNDFNLDKFDFYYMASAGSASWIKDLPQSQWLYNSDIYL